MRNEKQRMVETERESAQETLAKAATALGCSLVYLEREAMIAGLTEVAHLIGVAVLAAFEAVEERRREEE